MAQLNQQKLTEFEKKLAKKISLLNKKIKKLPAYSRRKKDEENWQDFFTFFLFIALAGIVIIGTGGWLAVAASGTLLSLIIVESGLFLSIAIVFSAWPLFNAYLWIRDLFCSAEIKVENKQYAQLKKVIADLKNLDEQVSHLDQMINCKLQISADVLAQAHEQGNTQKLPEFSENKKQEYVYKLFQESTAVPANIIIPIKSQQLSSI